MTGAALIDVRGLVGGYRNRAVVGPIALTIADNDTVALVGPNGVGKTTILKTLAGLIPPVAGTITYQGSSVRRAPVHQRARRGLVFVGEHRANVLRTLTVGENLDLAAGQRRATGQRHAAGFDPISLFPVLGARRRQLAGTLSGGELQMLSLAMALALAPRCLLLDEPSAGLAPIVLEEVRSALVRLRAAGLSIVVAEQRPDVVRGLCDRVAIVAGGELTFLEPDADLSSEALVAQYFSGGDAH